eukprot:8368165-Pyramimonas_sp.AAC.1
MHLEPTRRHYYTATDESIQLILGLPYLNGENRHPGQNTRIQCAGCDWHYTDTLSQVSFGNGNVVRA